MTRSMKDSVGKREPEKLYEHVINELKDMIVSGELKPGDKLPSERELGERFNVSRVPVREALKIMEFMGVVGGGRGDGTYLRSVNFAFYTGKMDLVSVVTADTMMDLMEFRVELESAAAYYASLRRTDEDIADMRRCISDMRELKKTLNPDDAIIARLRTLSHELHRCVVRAARNRVISDVYQNLYELLDISRQFTISTSGISYDSILAHEALVEKIAAGDCDGARARMAEHLDTVRHRMSNITDFTAFPHTEELYGNEIR